MLHGNEKILRDGGGKRFNLSFFFFVTFFFFGSQQRANDCFNFCGGVQLENLARKDNCWIL